MPTTLVLSTEAIASASRSSTPKAVPRTPALLIRTSSSGNRAMAAPDRGGVGDIELDDVRAERAGGIAPGGVAHPGVDGVAGSLSRRVVSSPRLRLAPVISVVVLPSQ